MARYDDLDTKTIAGSAVVSSIVLVVLILGGRALAYTWQGATEESRIEKAKYTASDESIATQKAVLKMSGKVEDPPLQEGEAPIKRNVVPIEKAQQIIGKELGKQPKA
jgi:hypothetical protein